MKINPAFLFFFFILLYSCEYTSFPQGKALYEGQCGSCHGIDGTGFKDLYPPLKNSDYFAKDPYGVACIIVNGMEGTIEVNGKSYDQPMQAIEVLTEVQITNILNYVASSWNPTVAVPINIVLVKEKLAECQDSPKVY